MIQHRCSNLTQVETFKESEMTAGLPQGVQSESNLESRWGRESSKAGCPVRKSLRSRCEEGERRSQAAPPRAGAPAALRGPGPRGPRRSPWHRGLREVEQPNRSSYEGLVWEKPVSGLHREPQGAGLAGVSVTLALLRKGFICVCGSWCGISFITVE